MIDIGVLQDCGKGVYARHGIAMDEVPEIWLTTPLQQETAIPA